MKVVTVIDPRFIEAFMEFLLRLGFHGYDVEWRKLPKAERNRAWAKVASFHDNRELVCWVGPTVGLSDEEVRGIAGHEAAHVLTSWLIRAGDLGNLIDEQACNVISKLLEPDQPRRYPEGKYTYHKLEIGMAKYMDDELRFALLEELPHLVVRLEPKYRDVLLALFYDYKSLRDYAEEQGVTQTAIRGRRDAALEALRQAVLAEPEGEVVDGA